MVGGQDVLASARALPSRDIARQGSGSPATLAAIASAAGKASAAAPSKGSPAQIRSLRAPDTARQASAATPLQIALQSGPEGIALVARAQRLSADEQIRLRIAIDALLSRHGLRARSVTINGHIQPPARGFGRE
jgi:hypothetical protein